MENTDVLEAIELVLKKSATPVSYKLVVISTRAHLRKVFLNSGVDHLTNKTEFEKHWFKKALESEDGKQKIRLLEKNTKVGLKGWHSQIPISNKPADGISIKEATDYMEVFIKHLHHTKLEELVSRVIENRYGYVKDKTHPAYKLTGDSGVRLLRCKE